MFFELWLSCSDRFLQDLREKCESKPGNTEFWSEVQKIGRGISLISDKEAKKYGGASQYSEAQAKKVRS